MDATSSQLFSSALNQEAGNPHLSRRQLKQSLFSHVELPLPSLVHEGGANFQISNLCFDAAF